MSTAALMGSATAAVESATAAAVIGVETAATAATMESSATATAEGLGRPGESSATATIATELRSGMKAGLAATEIPAAPEGGRRIGSRRVAEASKIAITAERRS